jgi:hypothetical protein
MAVTIKILGMQKAMRDINKYLVDYKGETDKVFFEFYAKVRQDCMLTTPTVPKDTGNLRNSMFFTYSKGKKDGRGAKQSTDLISKCQAECKMAYTINKPTAIIGFAAEYAAKVHEAVNQRFREPGSGAKYFETHIVSNENYFVELLKKHAK